MSRILLFNDDKLSYTVVILPYIKGIDGIDIWIKFVSYLKEDEVLFLESIKNKDIDSLSQNDFDNYYRIKSQINMSKLLKKYKNRECNKEEHDYVFNYMKNNDLESFINNRMTDEENNKSYNFIKSLSKESLDNYIDTNKNIFNELSIYDAYNLLNAEKELYNINNNEINNHILEEQRRSDRVLHKALIKEYGPMIYW